VAFSHYRTITVDHTLCGASNSTDFPVLVSGTYTYLKTTGNGGEVTNANGYDIGFYSDSGLTTKLDWEVEKYVSTTGEIVAWVRIPTLSHTSDTVIYIADGDSGITTFQGNVNGVWETAAKGVWHMNNGTGNNVLDSTSNTNTGTPVASPADATGQIGQALSFNGSSQEVWMPDSGLPTGDRTMSVWFNTSANEVWWQNSGIIQYGTNSSLADIGNVLVAGNWLNSVTINDGKWHLATLTVAYNGSWPSTWRIYLDGVQVAQSSVCYQDTTLNGTLSIGGGAYGLFNGSIDDVRIYNRALSADEITANYNSTNSPSTFYGVGSDQGGGGVATGFMTTMNGIWGI